jgi:hypothetical protein
MFILNRLALLAALLALPAAAQSPRPEGPLFMGFYESWKELPVPIGSLTRLAQMPGSVDLVAVSFVKPDLVFDGTHLKGTGLQLAFDAPVLKDAIAALKAAHPDTKVVLSVGGSAYKTWDQFQPEALARLVKAIGADGVDLDYEPSAPNCASVTLNGAVTYRCASEDMWVKLIQATRAVLPRPYIVSLQAWSVGAYGVGKFAGDIPPSPWTGSMLWLGRLPEAKDIDIVAVMAYDAGPSLDPDRAFAAYRALWPGQLLLGIEIPAEGSKEIPPSVARIKKLAANQAKDPKGGILLYAVTEDVKDGPSLNKPDGEVATKAICEGLGRKDCE